MVIEKIKITDASVAEEIRKGMQLATNEEKGLATPGMAYSTIKGVITLAADEEVKFDIKYSLICCQIVQPAQVFYSYMHVLM